MGLWLAALAGTAGVVIIVLAWKGTPTQAPKQTIAATPQPQAIDVPAGKANRALRNLGKGEELFVQMADKVEPIRG